MLFNSIDFMIFFPIVLLVYFVIPKKIRYVWLLIASYYFYMGWNSKYALLIALSTVMTYIGGILLSLVEAKNISHKVGWKKGVIIGSFTINLGILVFFKYFDFLLSNINRIVKVCGISPIERTFDVILPVGISFYTFQALGYIIDVYRGEIKAEKNLLKYALFVSFFPQLVAGPIERSKNLISQIKNIENMKLWNYKHITNGAMQMLWGLFLKMVIADRIAIFVDTVYDGYWYYGSIELVLATALFAIQIYCDFASYSLIAKGAALIMGFELMENFDTPYFAKSIKEFWRRWHISLSSWFRDYLYIPLGGSRCSRWKKYRNIMMTFLVSGLWHGANWNFVIWGGVHGIYQIVGSYMQNYKRNIINKLEVKVESVSYKFGQILITFVLVDFAWIFFRAKGIRAALCIIFRMFTKWNPWILFDQSLYNLGLNVTEIHVLVIAMVALLLVDWLKYKKGKSIEVFLEEQCLWFRWLTIFATFFGIIIYGVYGPDFSASAFIYFQF